MNRPFLAFFNCQKGLRVPFTPPTSLLLCLQLSKQASLLLYSLASLYLENIFFFGEAMPVSWDPLVP